MLGLTEAALVQSSKQQMADELQPPMAEASAWLHNAGVRETGAWPRQAFPVADAAFSITSQPTEHVNGHNFSNDAQDVRIHTGGLGALLRRATGRASAAQFQSRPMH